MGLFEDVGMGVGRAGLGVSTGGLSELFMNNPFGISSKNGRYDSPTPQMLMSPQQMEALGKLMAFTTTGQFGPGGKFTAGESYTGSLGDFNMTGVENASQSKLMGLLQGGVPESYGLGTDEIKKLLSTNSYDPNNDGGVYSGLTSGIDLNTKRAMDAVKQSGAFAGNLFSTGVGRNLGDTAIQGANQKSSILAQLYQDFANKKFNAIPLALQAGQGQENINQNRIAAGYQFGGLPRTLTTAKDQAQYGEFQRSRQEGMMPMNVLQSIYTSQPQWYTPTPSVETPSPWNRLLDTAIGVGSTALGYGLGGAMGGAIGGKVGGAVSSTVNGGGTPSYTPGNYSPTNTWLQQYLKASGGK